MQIKVERSKSLKMKPKDESKILFGTQFTDHMLYMEYDEDKGGWGPAEIRPYGTLNLEAGASCLHYGQSVWEGMKCYRTTIGNTLFRPVENLKRLNRSAQRICMPEIDIPYVLKSLKDLIKIEEDWIPHLKGSSLYIRPCLIASAPFLGVHVAKNYIFFIILSPAGSYFKEGFKPIKIMVEDKYVRAVKGGVGFAKTSGNYAASLKSSKEAEMKGFSQVLWLDGIHRKYVEEIGAMNVAFVKDNKIITPPLSGSILPGITRKSVLELSNHLGINSTEESICINDIIIGIQDGSITEAFGMGTAAVIAPIGSITYKDKTYEINNFQIGKITQRIYNELTDIQFAKKEDPFGWIEVI